MLITRSRSKMHKDEPFKMAPAVENGLERIGARGGGVVKNVPTPALSGSYCGTNSRSDLVR